MSLQNGGQQHLFVPKREIRLYLVPGQIVGVVGALSVWEQSMSGPWRQCAGRAVATVECEDDALDLTQVAGHLTVEVLCCAYEPGKPKLTGATVVVREVPPHLRHLLGGLITVQFAEHMIPRVRRPRVFRVIRGGITAPKIPRR